MSEILLSQLAHVELISPKPDETVRWMVDVLGLEETAREGQSVYLRGWAEWLHSSLIVTEGAQPAVEHIAWRTYGPDDPETIAKRLDGSGQEIGWVEYSVGHGRAFRYHAPVGRHVHEVFWETELYRRPPEKSEARLPEPPAEVLRSRRWRQAISITSPSPRRACTTTSRSTRRSGSATPLRSTPSRGSPCSPPRPATDSLHPRSRARPRLRRATGRANHIAYSVDQRLDVERAAEVFMANDTPIEFGPGIHGLDEITYLYVREPGGFRIEINAGGWDNAMPDWQADRLEPTQGGTTFWKNVAMPDSMMESWPAVPGTTAQECRRGLSVDATVRRELRREDGAMRIARVQVDEGTRTAVVSRDGRDRSVVLGPEMSGPGRADQPGHPSSLTAGAAGAIRLEEVSCWRRSIPPRSATSRSSSSTSRGSCKGIDADRPVPGDLVRLAVLLLLKPGRGDRPGRRDRRSRRARSDLDLELEVAVIIGRAGRNLPPEEAAAYIAGYTIFNDWSARDLQIEEMKLGLGICKGKDFANTLGPWIVTPDELEPFRSGDRLDLDLRARINDRELGDDTLANMAWSFEELIAYASRGAWIRPGDVLGSGTCGSGCLLELRGRHGRDAYPALAAGDTVTLSVQGIGELTNTIVAGVEPVPLPAARPGRLRARASA